MRMKTFSRALRILSSVTLFFFCWTFLPLWQAVAYAAEPRKMRNADPSQFPIAKGQTPLTSPLAKGGSRGVGETSGERFEKALEAIRENVGRLEKKHDRGEDDKAERELIRSRRAEIDSLDVELRKEFSATEKKLKDAKLPKEILDRHYKFVKHYEDNVKELKANLDGHEKAQKAQDKVKAKEYLRKTKAHLEKTKSPKKHVPLDPNNLPFQARKAKAAKAPRLKKEEFERDFPSQKQKGIKTALATPDSITWGQAYGHGSTRINEFSRKETQETQKIGHELTRIFTNGFQKTAQKPILVAANGPLTGLLPESNQPRILEVPSFVNFVPSVADAFTLNSELGTLNYEVAQATVDLPTAADLSETPEVQFTPEIRDLAAQLEYKPVKIFEWVRNNIDFAPAYSSIQGADMCLQTRQCNSVDTASLLIALLRVSNRPARYVYGTIEVPIDKIMNWIGGFTSERAALNFIASGGIPVTGQLSGGKIVAARLEHAWVETYIPYGNYRGAVMDESIKTWIPMDGSFKQYTYTNGFDMTATVPFSQDVYLSQVQSQNAVHYYQSQIQNYLDTNMPDTSIVDVKGYREIEQEKYRFLPATLPYITVAQLGKFSSVPANMTGKVAFTLTDPASGAAVSYTAFTSELAGKRITLSYIPATAADEFLIDSYGGFLYDVPAYMLHLKPVLRMEGIIKLTGEATTLGSEQRLTMQFMQPGGNTERVNKKLLAGAYYAVALDLQGINENVLGKRNYQLTTNVLSETAGTLGRDDLIGEHLLN